MTRERAAFAVLGLAAVAFWALVPTYPNYDAYYHLVWGRELLAGELPSFEAYAAPTQHPLYVALGALLALLGTAAGERALVLATLLSLVALTWAAYRLGLALFGRWPALLGALFVGSSFAFLLYAVRAYLDVPFLALVVWAAVCVVEDRRAPWLALGLLAIAGLLRPEAWVLAGLYGLWRVTRPGASTRVRAGIAALVAVAPLSWAAVDLAVTGDPLYSLSATGDLAEALGRERGIANVPSAFVTFLADVARPPVALAGVLGAVLAVRRFGARPMAVPLGLLGAGALTFVGTGIAGLSILPRYLTVPAVALCVLAGFGVAGFLTEPAGRVRTWWRRGAVAAAVLGAAYLVLALPSFGMLAGELRFIRSTHDDVRTLLATPAVRDGRRCGPVTLPTYRLVPDARWLLDASRGEVGSRAVLAPRGGVAIFVTGGGRAERRSGRADGVPRDTNDLPSGAAPDARVGPYAAYVSCP
jgi:hypothetical protein